MKFKTFNYQHAAPNDGAPAGGGAAAAVQPAAGADPAAPSALGSAAANSDWLPEKFRVVGADGKTVDIEASARKLATEGYSPLEKRLGAGDLPPVKVEDYKLAPPEGFDAEAFKAFATDPDTQAALKDLHALGLNDKQANGVLHKWLEKAPQLIEGQKAQSVDDTLAELGKVWSNEADLQKNMGAAYNASVTVAGKLGMKFEDLEAAGLGNNPTFIRLMAALAPEMGEDKLPGNGAPAGAPDFDAQVTDIDAQLTKMAPHDPERTKLIEKKMALFEQKYPKRK